MLTMLQDGINLQDVILNTYNYAKTFIPFSRFAFGFGLCAISEFHSRRLPEQR